MKITVFTPSYNRGYIIGELYNSLREQTFTDFEWLIVDDGSTDNTETVVANFLKENSAFSIRYYKVENGGKHRAINKALKLALGDLFFIVDSDDTLPSDALMSIVECETSICNYRKKYAGICGLKSTPDGHIVGSGFCGILDISTIDSRKLHIYGDKAEVFYTAVLRKYPFPEIPNEKFCTESIVWDRISYDGYVLRFFDKIIYNCDYLDDGLTKQGLKLYARNPIQWGISINQDYRFGKTSWWERSVQVYKYFLLLRHVQSSVELRKNLSIGKIDFFCSVFLQKSIDIFRFILSGRSIKHSLVCSKK